MDFRENLKHMLSYYNHANIERSTEEKERKSKYYLRVLNVKNLIVEQIKQQPKNPNFLEKEPAQIYLHTYVIIMKIFMYLYSNNVGRNLIQKLKMLGNRPLCIPD